MKTKVVAYWVTTAFLVVGVLSGGIAELVLRQENVEGITHELGYPLYVLAILGFWKVLGTLALLAPGFPRLKEWAYAGIFFNMTGAFISHAASGSAAFHLIYTGFFVVLTVASWALRPPSRTLGILFPAKTRAVAVEANTASRGL